jgi:hypothetical protein
MKRRNVSIMAEWWSIEVLGGESAGFSAQQWREQHESALTEAAVTNRAVDWSWHSGSWGVMLEVAFDTEEHWAAFRRLPAVQAALDAVPDPVNGLLIYRGRGGGAGAGRPRRPRPAPSAASAALPEPAEERRFDLTSSAPPEVLRAGTASG